MILCFYKCRWCGQTFERKSTHATTPEQALTGVMKEVWHHCDGPQDDLGRVGVADLLGARRPREDPAPK